MSLRADCTSIRMFFFYAWFLKLSSSTRTIKALVGLPQIRAAAFTLCLCLQDLGLQDFTVQPGLRFGALGFGLGVLGLRGGGSLVETPHVESPWP